MRWRRGEVERAGALLWDVRLSRPRCAVNRLPSAALPRSGWLALGIVYGIGRALNVDTA